MSWRALALMVVAAVGSSARADAPAPWTLCRGAQPGDPCSSRYYPRGRCLAERACAPGDETCLQCVAGADTSFRHDALPAALSLAGLVGLVAFSRRWRATSAR